MRYLSFFLFFLISISVFAQQPSSQPCHHTRRPSDAGTLTSLAENDIIGLQLGLFWWSKFQTTKPEDVANLQKLASGAVFSLANAFSAYGDRFQRCSLPDAEYNEKTRQANTSILFLLETIGQDGLNVLETGDWPLKNISPSVGHLADNPAIRGHKLPMHPTVENTLRIYARQWGLVDVTDPVQIAALELLGEKQNWNVREFKLIRFFQLNGGNMLNDREFFYSYGSEEFRAKSISERLAILADRYLTQ